MYEDFAKLAQDAMKPALKLAEYNTDLMVKMLQSQSAKTAELMQGNLEHAKALSGSKDLNQAVEMQQKYLEGLNEQLVAAARENAAAIEKAVSEAGKILEGSFAEVQAQARQTVEKLEAEFGKAARAARGGK